MPHFVCASCSVWLPHVGWAAHDELNLVVELLDDVLGNVQDQVDALLAGHSADECEEWNGVVEVLEVEVLLLKLPLCSGMIRSNCI